MRRLLSVGTVIVAVALSGVVLAGGSAEAQGGYLYGGTHPIHPGAGGGFCYTPEAHAHEYGVDPNIEYLYRSYNGYQHFVGNVYDFGYEGEAFPYYGHHPIPSIESYCYLDGLHYHSFLPPPTYASSYVVYSGYYYYRGVFSPGYYSYRTPYYRARPTYWYLPAYRAHHRGYSHARRIYARPASVSYIRRPPRIVYQPRGNRPGSVRVNPVRDAMPRRPPQPPRPQPVTITRPPPRLDGVRRPSPVSTPAYHYNTQRPSTYDTHYRQPQARQPVRPQVLRPVRPQSPAVAQPQPTKPRPPQPVKGQDRRGRTWRR